MIPCSAERGNFGDLGFAEQAQRLQKPKQSDTISEGRKLGRFFRLHSNSSMYLIPKPAISASVWSMTSPEVVLKFCTNSVLLLLIDRNGLSEADSPFLFD